jgi:hypothetical protein
MSAAICGTSLSCLTVEPGCRFAHPGYEADNVVIASVAKQSILPLAEPWIASSLRSSQ